MNVSSGSIGPDQTDGPRWQEAISEGGFRYRLGTRPADAADYFAATAAHRRILDERRHWLQTDPDRYVAVLPEGITLLDETIGLAARWGTLERSQTESMLKSPDPITRCTELGMAWEPDFALLQSGPNGKLILAAGSVCFPTHWRLGDKIGRPIDVIHGPVPGLNGALGASIDAFLLRMKPGTCWRRSNWSLTRTSELNQYPERNVTRLAADCTAKDVWLRFEHQALVPLPETRGVLFGIRIEHVPFPNVVQEPDLPERLRQTIETIPDDVLHYKCPNVSRSRLLAMLTHSQRDAPH